MKDEKLEKAEAVLRTCKLSGAEMDFLETLLDEASRYPAFEFEEHQASRLKEICWNHGVY